MSVADILAEFPPADRTLPTMLQHQARRYGSHPLAVTSGGIITFEEAPTLAARFAGTLAAAGIRPGDRVALMCANRAEFIECFAGCAWLGAIAVPINIASRGPQLQHILSNSGARLLIIETELLNALDHVDTSGLALQRIWLIGDEATRKFDRIAVSTVPPRAAATQPGATDPAQLLAILYTSGTTGPSKGVCCPQAQYFWWGINGIRNLEIREGDVLCTSLPLFHSNALGTFYKAILSGSTLVAEPRFSASRFWQNLVDHRATAAYVLGAMVPILLSREPSPQERNHSVRCGLGPGVPANLHIAFEQRSGIRLIDGYGSTETNFVIGSTTTEQRPGSMGKVGDGYHARVLDRGGNDAKEAEPGELILSADDPLAFASGYFAMPDKTAESFRDGWFHTGDRVLREADGSFRFMDRLKDAIRRRGENISSFEVEQVLLSNPAVASAAVFAVPSELAEEEVMAAIVRRPGSALTESALCEFCAPRLAHFAVPRFIEFVDTLPMTENGKVQKYRLRDRGVTPGTWDRAAAVAPAQRERGWAWEYVMAIDLPRRTLLQLIAGAAAGVSAPFGRALAASDAATLAWPNDVPSWDPNQRFTPDAQPIFKAVFDQPLDQDPQLKLIPHLIKTWNLAPDALSMAIELRDDVTFHNGDKMTTADFRYTFFERIKSGVKLDVANSMRKVQDIVIESPTKATMKFDTPAPTMPQWMAFLGSYVVPKNYIESGGLDNFLQKPIGTGPYKLAEYELNSRIVLERYDNYWGLKPKIAHITIQIVKDPSARVAAIQSGQVDCTINVPVREVQRFAQDPAFVAEINPITRVILLNVRADLAFADKNVRLAAHHAIDKASLSKAFYGGVAVPLSVLATPGTPGYITDFTFKYDPALAKKLLAQSGFSPDKPVKIGLAATNGQFPSDYDMARAIVAMWKTVGIDADLQVIEYAKYFELNRGGKLPEATLYSWDNSTGDPEIFSGYQLNPKMPFSPWKDEDIGNRVLALFGVADNDKRIAGYRDLERYAVENGATMPLLQSVVTVVRKKNLAYKKFGNGWLLPQTLQWS